MSVASVFIVNRFLEELLPALRARFPKVAFDGVEDFPQFPDHRLDADVLVTWRLPSEWLPHLPNLKWIQCTGAGVDKVLGTKGISGSVVISRMHQDFSAQMAEYALGCVTHSAFRWPIWETRQREQQWNRSGRELLRGRVAGVMGVGVIGSEVARVLRGAGLRVWGWSRSGAPCEGCERVFAASALDEFLQGLDYVILVLPLTTETRGLLDDRRLGLLRKDAILINMARAEILVEGALQRQLEAGRLKSCYLDVFWNEPLPPGDPWWTRERVVVTPHIAGLNRAPEMVDEFSINLERYLRGEPLLNVVDCARGY